MVRETAGAQGVPRGNKTVRRGLARALALALAAALALPATGVAEPAPEPVESADGGGRFSAGR